jgi:acyl-CoA thioesterase FadM
MANVALTAHRLRPSDIDIWGHLNHSKAVELFELGRFDWVLRMRFPLDREWVPVVTRIDVVYRREVLISEVVIKTEMVERKHYTAGFHQEILVAGADAGPAVTGRVWLSFLNKANRRPMRLRELDIPGLQAQHEISREPDREISPRWSDAG